MLLCSVFGAAPERPRHPDSGHRLRGGRRRSGGYRGGVGSPPHRTLSCHVMVKREEEALSGRPKTRSYCVQRDRGYVISVEIGDVLFFFGYFRSPWKEACFAG